MSIKSQGSSLIEILIAITLFSIGLLGIAALQMQTMKMNHNSALRSSAILLTQDLIDRMRANAQAMAAGAENPYLITPVQDYAYHPNCFGKNAERQNNNSSCSSVEMAQTDLFQWTQAIQNQLPSGSGSLCIDSHPSLKPINTPCDGVVVNNTPIYVIRIYWTEKMNTQDEVHGYFVSFSA